MKKRIYTLLFCGLGSALLVAVMAYFAAPKNYIGNGFIRVLPSKKIVGIGFVRLHGRLHYFAGGDSTHIVLGNWAKPTELLKIGLPDKRLDTIKMKAVDLKGLMQGAYVDIREKDVFLMDGIGGSYFKADIASSVFGKRNPMPHFTAAKPLGTGRFILRVVHSDSLMNSLVKRFPDSSGKALVLDGRANSMFATDGELCATPDGIKLFYNYYYKNQFLCLDTNLKIMYTGKTIDTCSVAQVKVARVASERSLTLAAPPRRVNVRAAANDSWFFVQSAIKAENETEAGREGVSVVDVYGVSNGAYQFSLYIPDFKDQKLRDFRVYGKYFVALYKECVYIYKLNF